LSATAKAMVVWNTLLERAQGEEDKFRRYLDAFQVWSAASGGMEAQLAAKAIRFRLLLREGKPLMVRWGMQ
jgi:hypothetical protein